MKGQGAALRHAGASLHRGLSNRAFIRVPMDIEPNLCVMAVVSTSITRRYEARYSRINTAKKPSPAMTVHFTIVTPKRR